MKFARVRYTPVYYINGWKDRLALRQEMEAMAKVMQLVPKTAVLG